MAEKRVRRILVALEPSEHGRAALDAATEMAARLGAELVGVFVEDIDLLHMAGLPFVQEFSYAAIGGRPVDRRGMERVFRGQATRLRRQMASVAERSRVRWKFRVARGRVAMELLAAAEEADMVIVGKAARPGPRRARVGSTARTIIREGRHTVVILHRGVAFDRPVLVLFDGSAPAQRALVTGARIAREDHEHIVVLLTARTKKDRAKLRTRAARLLAEIGLGARYVELPRQSLGGLLAALEGEKCRTVILPGDSAVLQEQAIAEVIEQLCCPVILVR